jgi:uncharacterized membrane protein YfcA
MHDYLFYLALTSGIFAGAIVSGFAGFAFSAVAGIVLMHLLVPGEAVPLMMACSIAVQLIGMVTLRRCMDWRTSLPFLIGGAAGIPPAVYLLHHMDTWTLRIGFGLFIAAYACYMLVCPTFSFFQKSRPAGAAAAVGFAGGLIGGLTAMPGAAPTIWCNLCGMPKDEQRGVVQPYIMIMQCIAIVVLLGSGGLSRATLFNTMVGLPALAAGTAIGIYLFRRASPASYRRVVLSLLFAGGIGLVL